MWCFCPAGVFLEWLTYTKADVLLIIFRKEHIRDLSNTQYPLMQGKRFFWELIGFLNLHLNDKALTVRKNRRENKDIPLILFIMDLLQKKCNSRVGFITICCYVVGFCYTHESQPVRTLEPLSNHMYPYSCTWDVTNSKLINKKTGCSVHPKQLSTTSPGKLHSKSQYNELYLWLLLSEKQRNPTFGINSILRTVDLNKS